MKIVRTALLLFSCFFILSCNDESDDSITKNHDEQNTSEAMHDHWKTTSTELFSIDHPEDWTADLEGKMGTKLFLFAQPDGAEDRFNENINLMSEKLPDASVDLDMYVKISEENITQFIADAEIIKSERVKLNGKDFQNVNYTGTQSGLKLRFEQYYTIANGEAYILTLTCKQDTYEKYQEVGSKILKSFKLLSNP